MTPAQCRAARALLNWTQPKLAENAGVGLSTVVDHEKERRVVSDAAVSSIRTALERAGVEFIAENGGGAGVRLSRPRRVVANSQTAPASEEKSRAGEE